MAKLGLAVLALVLSVLCGCSPMIYDQYVVITPHEVEQTQDSQDYVVAQNYLSLKNALLDMVESGETTEKIRMYDYVGDLETDFAKAAEDLLHNDALGAYALEDLEYDLAFVVSYYESAVTLTYRRTPEQIEAIERLELTSLTGRVERALADLETEVVVRDTFFTKFDGQAVVDAYYNQYPATCVEKPTVTVNTYPDSGYVRTVELLLTYENTVEDLTTYRADIETSVRAAEEYVRYREEQLEKLHLLYSFFNQRFVYQFEETNTPVYSFLCKGIASSQGVAKSVEIICQAMDMECYTVSGTKLGVAYAWNVLEVDGSYYHLDLQDALTRGLPELQLLVDEEMVDYQWDRDAVPACTREPVEPIVERPLVLDVPQTAPDQGEVFYEEEPLPQEEEAEPEEEEQEEFEDFEENAENDLTNDESVVQ